MPKRTKKLIVYLDQNFISEMAKADSKKSVKDEFRHIYKLLHEGFLDEKLVVPTSWFHEVETSLAVELKERIVSCQNFLGQIRLNFPESVRQAQIMAYASKFKGAANIDPLAINIAFIENPDKRIKMLNVVVDSHLESFDFKSSRMRTAQDLESLRQKIISSNISYIDQFRTEMKGQQLHCLKANYEHLIYLFNDDEEKVLEFIMSDIFSRIPCINIEAKLMSYILTKFRDRVIKESDCTDIDIISTYLPYIDVFATDGFIAERIIELGIDSDYNIDLFDARTSKLHLFIKYLEKYLQSSRSVNVPSISIFVLPTPTIKEKSIELFRSLGISSTQNINGKDEWVDIYGFDDGDMPKYRLERGRDLKIDLPFYGLQEINVIRIKPHLTFDEIIVICKEKSRSNKFLIIDKYSELSNDFVLGLMVLNESLGATYNGYRVYEK